jgi:WD40 repeat protein
LFLKEFARPTTNYVIRTVCFSPNSRLLAWHQRNNDRSRTAHVWDLSSAEEIFVSPSKIAALTNDLAFYPDSKLLTFVSKDDVIEAWDVQTGQRAFYFGLPEWLQSPTDRLDGHLALSGDGRRFATESGRAVTVWDTENRKLLFMLPEENGAVWCQAWSPNRDLLAVGTSVGGPVIWNIPKIRAQLAELGLDW